MRGRVCREANEGIGVGKCIHASPQFGVLKVADNPILDQLRVQETTVVDAALLLRNPSLQRLEVTQLIKRTPIPIVHTDNMNSFCTWTV